MEIAVSYDSVGGWVYYDAARPDHFETAPTWTGVFAPDGEEIDVKAFTADGARAVLLAAYARDYEPGLELAHVFQRPKGFMTF